MAGMLDRSLGRFGCWTFLIGFWGAVATSMLGVWQSVPYMFCDFIGLMKKLPANEHKALVSTRSPWYRGDLAYLALAPVLLLFHGKPTERVALYAVVGALLMPFLAATLLYMNSRRDWAGDRLRNGWLTKRLLALVLFAYLCGVAVLEQVQKLRELFTS